MDGYSGMPYIRRCLFATKYSRTIMYKLKKKATGTTNKMVDNAAHNKHWRQLNWLFSTEMQIHN